jgi:ribosome-binding factor A
MGHKPFVQEKASHRPAKFAQRVKEELSQLLPHSLRDPRMDGIAFITITSVEITPDLKHANVMFGLMGEEKRAKDVQEALNQAAGFLRKELMRRLNSKTTPHLNFKFDKGFANVLTVDSLLKKIGDEDK